MYVWQEEEQEFDIYFSISYVLHMQTYLESWPSKEVKVCISIIEFRILKPEDLFEQIYFQDFSLHLHSS